MIVTSIAFFLMIFIGMSKKLSKKRVCIIIGILLFLILAFRDISLGSVDTAHYVDTFENLSGESIASIYKNVEKDQTFWALAVVFSKFFQSSRMWLIFLSAEIMVAVTFYIKKLSPLPAFSFIMYYLFSYYNFNFSILRQTVAFSIVLLMIVYMCKQDKPSIRSFLIFLVFVLCASLFHAAAITTIVIYPFRFLKSDWKAILIIGVAFLFSFIVPSNIVSFISTYFTDERYAHYVVGVQKQNSILSLLLYLAIFVFCYIRREKIRKVVPYADFLIWMMAIGCSVWSMSTLIAEFMRLALFFNVTQIIALPLAITCFFDSNRVYRSGKYQSDINYEGKIVAIKKNQTSNLYRIILLCFTLYFFFESNIFQMNYFFGW